MYFYYHLSKISSSVDNFLCFYLKHLIISEFRKKWANSNRLNTKIMILAVDNVNITAYNEVTM